MVHYMSIFGHIHSEMATGKVRKKLSRIRKGSTEKRFLQKEEDRNW